MIIEQNKDVISIRIWHVVSRFKGMMTDSQMQQVVIAFLFLRRIDCMIGQYAKESYSFYSNNRETLSDKRLAEKLCEISGGHPFYNYSGYNFSGILQTYNAIEVVLHSFIQGFSENIKRILNGMSFEQNVAVLQRRSMYLVELVDYFAELDLSEIALDNKCFIDLITTIASKGSSKGELYPTPIGLSKLICECLFCDDACEGLTYDFLDVSDEVSIYDPVCGTGSLLAYAGEKAKTKYQENVYLIGKEISSFSCAIANALILLTGNKYSYADDVNTLTEDSSEFEYHFVVADLPLGLSWTPIRERIESEYQKEEGRFNKGLPSVNDSQFLFIQDIVSKMDGMGGRAAFISSSFVLQGGSVKSGESRIRRWLFESGLVETIIALPSGILSPYTSIPVFLWILSFNNNPSCNKFCEKLEGKVRLIDATKLISPKGQFKLDDEFINSVVKEYKSFDNTSATQIVNTEELGFYEVNLLENGKKKETVSISLNTDINEFVKKERQPYSKGEITVDYSSVEKGYLVDFSKFFKSTGTEMSSLNNESEDMLSLIEEIIELKSDVEKMTNQSRQKTTKKSWKELPLRSVVELVKEISKTKVALETNLPYISVSYLRGDSSENKYPDSTAKVKYVTAEDVIYIRTGANAGEIFKGADGYLYPTLGAIRCTNDDILMPQYLYYLLKGNEKDLMSLTTGVSIKNLNATAILDYKCSIPSLAEQERITFYLDNMVEKLDKIISKLNSKNSIFNTFRQTLIENVVHGRFTNF